MSNLCFGFKKHFPTSHGLIHITENIIKAHDDGCRAFVDLQKAFETVDRQVLLAELDHLGICGVLNDRIKSYLSNCNHYVSINVCDCHLVTINFNVAKVLL